MKRLLLLLCCAPAALAQADWPADASVNVPVANVDTSEYPSAVADGQGGVYVVFAHADSTSSVTLRGEHFSAAGDRLWGTATPDGGFLGLDLLGLSLGTGTGGKAMAVPDLGGGFIAAYTSGGNAGPWTLNLQDFGGDSGAAWEATGAFGGVQLLASLDYYNAFYIVPDTLGGALAVYGVSSGIAGQRVDETGTPDYGATGYLFSQAQYPGPFYPSHLMGGDGQGGMYFIWPNAGSEASDPLITYLTPTGAVGFQVPSAIPATAPFEQWGIAGLPDGGGVWNAWYGALGTTGNAVFLQEFAPDAGTVFDAGGLPGLPVAMLTSGGTAAGPMLLGDGSGGVIAVWYAASAGTGALYAQRFGPDATPMWGANPVVVSGAASVPMDPDSYLWTYRLVAAPNGDPTLVWSSTPSGLFAQQLDLATGALEWSKLTGGVEVSSIYSPAYVDVAFAADGSAYVTYQDSVNAIYLKRIEADGTLGETTADAGTDAGVDGGSDGGTDGGSDAGSTEDAGPPADAGTDAGVDAGPADAGGKADAGSTDAGTSDAGTSDGGTGHDAGPTDAGGSPADAGTNPDGGQSLSANSGCGCGSSGGSPWSAALLVFGSMLLRRRRR